MRLPNSASLAPALDRLIRKRPCRMRTWQQTVIERPALRRRSAHAVRNRDPEVWLPGRITVSVAFPEIAPTLDNSDDGIPFLGSPEAVEKTKGKQAYSRPRQAATRFSQTGQIGSAGVIEFPTMRSRLALTEFVEAGQGAACRFPRSVRRGKREDFGQVLSGLDLPPSPLSGLAFLLAGFPRVPLAFVRAFGGPSAGGSTRGNTIPSPFSGF